MSLKRLIGAGALSLYASVVGINSYNEIQEYNDQRETVFREEISDHIKRTDLGLCRAWEDVNISCDDQTDNNHYYLAVNVGAPTSITAGLFAVYLLFGKGKKED
jgi:hypothetical protein